MKRILWLLCVLLGVTSFMSCDSEEDCYIDGGPVPIWLVISISDAEGLDLLDSQNETSLCNGDYKIVWNGNTCKFSNEYVHPNNKDIISYRKPTEALPGALIFSMIGMELDAATSGNIIISWNGGAETTEITYDLVRKDGVLVTESYTVNGVTMTPSPYNAMLSIVKE